MTPRTAIIGIGITPFGKFIDRSLRSLSEEAVANALKDAGITAADVDRVFFGNGVAGLITGQEMIRGQVALRYTGLAGKPLINVENACASGSSAFYLAWQAVESGQADIALAVGAEKLSHVDKTVSSGAFGAAIDLEQPLPLELNEGSGTVFMDIYAARARKYMDASGATDEDLAQIVVKSRAGGHVNPIAHFRKETTVEEVLASRMISKPLTLPMCSSMSDGAAAVVLCSTKMLARLGVRCPVYVAGSVLVAGMGDNPELPNCAERAGAEVYALSGIGPSEVHVVELHDGAAPGELMHYEELQLCRPGEGPALLRSGATRIGGRIPVNPSGGLLSRGHPIGATGIAQLVELTNQLRGDAGGRQREGAKVALADNGGGRFGSDSASGVATILCT